MFSSQSRAADPTVGLSLPGVAAGVSKDYNPLLVSEEPALSTETCAEVERLEQIAVEYQREEPVGRVFAAGVEPGPGEASTTSALEPLSDLAADEVQPEDASPPADLEPPPLFTIYEVQPGDTVSSIAGAFGLQPESLIWNNVEISDEDLLAVGQLLRIPATDGVIHEMRLGDTLTDVAGRYGVDLAAVTTFTSNGIEAPDDVQEMQLVFVPGGTVAPPPEPEPEPAVDEPSEAAGSEAREQPAYDESAPAVDFTPSAGLIWPVTGPISSYMGPSHPLGIDIDLYNSPGAPILSATSGVVTFAGGDPCCSYGLYVVVVSPGGIETLYAHLSSINVVQGQQVSQGSVLGYGGCTGYCTGNHLHFEVIDNGVRQDPLAYLP